MATNTSTNFQADVRRILDHDTLEVAQRFLVVSQFADKRTMDKNAGLTWTATRFNRLPVPFAPLSEGVPPIGETLTITQVAGTAIQWGDKVTFTDVATITIQHDLLHEATERLGMQIAEMRERNAMVALMAGLQVNFVNQRQARGSIVAGDVLDPVTVNRTVANLKNLGAPMWSGQTGETVQRAIDHNVNASEKGPKTSEHYVAVGSPLVMNDFAQNPTVVQAWSYSDVTRLYINETGYWRGMHFCESNMIPTFFGVGAVGATPSPGSAGSLANNTYFIQITGQDTQNQYESRIYNISSGVVVSAGGTGSISLTTPSTANFTYNVYISTSSTVIQNLATTSSTAAPSTGPYAGQATQIPASTAIVLTGTGIYQVPPAAPGSGVTVFPTFIFGQRAFACLKLEGITWTRLFEADKSDPNNQLRVIGWKLFEGWVILNNQFLARIESSASSAGTFG